jgi:hypothetical protein
MIHHDRRTLIDQGRKAGLTTAELYSALGAKPPAAGDGDTQADSNGFIAAYDEEGQRTYRPGNERER